MSWFAKCTPRPDLWAIYLPGYIVLPVRIFFWFFSIVKLVEIWSYNIWLINHGAVYREKMLGLVREHRTARTIPMAKMSSIDREHAVPWPIPWKLGEHFAAQEKSVGLLRRLGASVCRVVGKYVDRQPILVLSLSTLLMVFPDRSLGWLEMPAEMALILLLVLSALVDLLLARALLGFIDNFRRDFEMDPVQYYRQGTFGWSKTKFLGKFLFGVVFFLGTSTFGFGAVFYGLYQTCGEVSFRTLLENDMPVQLQLLYLSLVTVATVGYGDIHPNIGIAQMVVGLEILLGMGVLVFLIFSLATTFTDEME